MAGRSGGREEWREPPQTGREHERGTGAEKKPIKVAIIGVGNCASSLVQGVHYYRNAPEDERVPGLMHVNLGGYHIRDIEFTAAFDIDENKVGKDLSEAIFAEPNNTYQVRRRAEPGCAGPPRHDPRRPGQVPLRRSSPRPRARPPTSSRSSRTRKTDVVVTYLPVGSEMATKWYVEQVLEAGCGFVNCIPVFIAREPYWQQALRGARACRSSATTSRARSARRSPTAC